jgi:hypothetical protein
MADTLRPPATKTYGKKNYILIPTWAGFDSGTGPTVAEITSASGLDITRIVFADGAPNPTQATNLVEQQRRWGDTQTAEFIGETKHSGGQMDYALAPQAAALAAVVPPVVAAVVAPAVTAIGLPALKTSQLIEQTALG